jgi:2-polyprenyl-6-methoxyphenol hydroxylase-like FAD-dependent oxidoreductase
VPAVNNVLVVGAGVAGTAAAIFLAEKGIHVELVEQKPEVTALGSGITLQGNALRVLRDLGVWESIKAEGYGFAVTGLRAPDSAATLLAEIPDAATGGAELPATFGLPRPELARVLVARAIDVGVVVRFGMELIDLNQDEAGVNVSFSDGSTGGFDLVIGADGLHSKVRSLIGIETEPAKTGMAIWRVFTPRPRSVTRTDLFYGGPSYIAGYCPTGDDSLYAYIVEDANPEDFGLDGPQRAAALRRLSEAYHGPWDDIRPLIDDDRDVNYTLFESHVVEGPWNRGRAVIIGDATHSCPPTLAQGAAQSLEDAAVLAELLVDARLLDATLWETFTLRRLGRARQVVKASLQLCDWLIDGQHQDEVPELMAGISALVSERP